MIFIVTTLNFKDIIDLPKWRPLATNLFAPTSNSGITSDLRNNEDRHPLLYAIGSATTFNAYDAKNDQWLTLASPALGGSFHASFFMPAQGPRGTIAAGATTTSIPLTTALPATVNLNQLANRGDGRGFKVRIIGNAAGSSGKTEERLVIANTGPSTTPTLLLDSALSFTPIAGDAYEFLSGRVFFASFSSPAWKYYDVLTNSFSAALSIVNLVTGSDSVILGLDELLVPYDRDPGEGFFGILTATASAAATLTGQAVGGDAGVVANQYRNFQIHVIQDVAIPTAVGQRRNITSHTAGPSPVYTVPAWTVTPSATATYVIENNGDRILAWITGSTSTFTYSISANTWSTATFAVRPVVAASAVTANQAFSIEPDTASPPNARQSFIFSFRGTTSGILDLFDIAGAATGTWTANITYGNSGNATLISTGSCTTQDPATMEGRYLYISSVSQRYYRFDMKNNVLEEMTFLRVPEFTNFSPYRMFAQTVFIDGSTKLTFLIRPTSLIIAGTQASFVFGLPITR